MIKILFVCHGNICRSTMAEFVMKDLVERQGLSDKLIIESAATSTEEVGNPVYPPVAKLLAGAGIDCSEKRARQMKRFDYERFDLLIGMDDANIRNMLRISDVEKRERREFPRGFDVKDKIYMLLDFTERPGSVADPWYTRDFGTTWKDVNEGCRGLLEAIRLRTV